MPVISFPSRGSTRLDAPSVAFRASYERVCLRSPSLRRAPTTSRSFHPRNSIAPLPGIFIRSNESSRAKERTGTETEYETGRIVHRLVRWNVTKKRAIRTIRGRTVDPPPIRPSGSIADGSRRWSMSLVERAVWSRRSAGRWTHVSRSMPANSVLAIVFEWRSLSVSSHPTFGRRSRDKSPRDSVETYV